MTNILIKLILKNKTCPSKYISHFFPLLIVRVTFPMNRILPVRCLFFWCWLRIETNIYNLTTTAQPHNQCDLLIN